MVLNLYKAWYDLEGKISERGTDRKMARLFVDGISEMMGLYARMRVNDGIIDITPKNLSNSDEKTLSVAEKVNKAAESIDRAVADSETGNEYVIIAPLTFDNDTRIGEVIYGNDDPIDDHLRGFILDISQRFASRFEDRFLVMRDGLTLLYNQRMISPTFDQVLDPNNSSEVSLVSFDIDHFKWFNDTYIDHKVGDRVLKDFSSILRNVFRDQTEFIIRSGYGEEFMVIIEGMDKNTAKRYADEVRLRSRAYDTGLYYVENADGTGKIRSESDNPDAVKHMLTVSGGVTSWSPKMPISSEDLCRQAESALYHAKHSGRDRIHVYGGRSRVKP
jgi:diguanylate cyclase (GGDEF)-like protein